MNFYFKLENNFYCLDGFRPLLNEIYLERILFVDGEIVYTEDYHSVSIAFFFGELFDSLRQMWRKSRKMNIENI